MGITAKNLINQLQNDPVYIARQKELVEHQKQAKEEYIRIATPLLKDLAQAGFPVESLDVFINTNYNYQGAIPILLKWLPKIKDKRVKESIIRSLSISWGKPIAAKPLIKEFIKLSDTESFSLKWAIGNALEIVADDSIFDEIVNIVQNKKHGRSREMVVMSLGKMKNPKAVDVAISLLEDEEVAGQAITALGKLKAKKAVSYIKPFLNHQKAWIRQEAKKTLARLEKIN